MNPFMNDCEPNELIHDLRLCAHKLLLAYNSTLQTAFWEASEKAAEACAHLMAIIDDTSPYITLH